MAALVQSVTPGTTTTANSQAISPSATAAGSLIVIFVCIGTGGDVVSSITDGGNTYQKAVSSAVNKDSEIWYAYNCSTTSTITVNYSGSTQTKSVYMREYSGMDTTSAVLEQTKAANGTGDTCSTGSISATTGATEILVCTHAWNGSGGLGSGSAGAGWGNFLAVTAGTAQRLAIEDITVSVGAVVAGAFTTSGGVGTPSWDVTLAAFFTAGSAPNTSPRYRLPDYGRYISVGNGMSRSEIAN